MYDITMDQPTLDWHPAMEEEPEEAAGSSRNDRAPLSPSTGSAQSPAAPAHELTQVSYHIFTAELDSCAYARATTKANKATKMNLWLSDVPVVPSGVYPRDIVTRLQSRFLLFLPTPSPNLPLRGTSDYPLRHYLAMEVTPSASAASLGAPATSSGSSESSSLGRILRLMTLRNILLWVI